MAEEEGLVVEQLILDLQDNLVVVDKLSTKC